LESSEAKVKYHKTRYVKNEPKMMQKLSILVVASLRQNLDKVYEGLTPAKSSTDGLEFLFWANGRIINYMLEFWKCIQMQK